MSAAAPAIEPRGWCPGLRTPMATGDGLLARIHPPGGALTVDQARLVADAARAHGNGLLDVTARGNLQVRGLDEASHPRLLDRLEGAGLAEPLGSGPGRLVLTSPLAGLDPAERFDPRPIAAAIEAAVVERDDLPAKTFVAVDAGGAFPLDGTGADILATALDGSRVLLSLAAPPGPQPVGTVGLDDAAGAVAAILRAFAAWRRAGRSRARRLRDLEPAPRAELAGGLDALAAAGGARANAPRAGIVPTSAGRSALLAALPFGRCRADDLALAADWAARHGDGEIRPAFTRGLLLPGLSAAAAEALRESASESGFIVDPGDPRLAVAACPGSPDCASAAVPAPADAAVLAEAARALLATGATFHVSGCAKGCAQPRAADLTLVGRADGCYGVILCGTARDAPVRHLPLDRIEALLKTLNRRESVCAVPDARP